jgi:pimeloyl-ACP methyl ester carboxylesterase
MSEPIDETGPRADAEAAADRSPSGIRTTAARALVLGSALSTPAALSGIDNDLVAIGVEGRPKPWGSWKHRAEIYEDSDSVLLRYGVLDEIRELEQQRWVATADDNEPLRSARVDLWREVAQDANQSMVLAWLRMLMTDHEPATAAAAASALSVWRRTKDIPVPAALEIAKELLPSYAESGNLEAQAIAGAALGLDDVTRELFAGDRSREDLAYGKVDPRSDPVDGSTSIIVHGTYGWAENWWFIGGEFHTYLLSEVRSDLYCGRNPFTWSGAYRKKHREIAAERLADWAQETVRGTLNSVFAHSYGGVIALNATRYGLSIKDLVLLSVPAEKNIRVEWRNIDRAVSLRIHMDLVLLAARRPQCFTENVEEYYLPHWFVNHSDSHDPALWRKEDSARTLNLTTTDDP